MLTLTFCHYSGIPWHANMQTADKNEQLQSEWESAGYSDYSKSARAWRLTQPPHSSTSISHVNVPVQVQSHVNCMASLPGCPQLAAQLILHREFEKLTFRLLHLDATVLEQFCQAASGHR